MAAVAAVAAVPGKKEGRSESIMTRFFTDKNAGLYTLECFEYKEVWK